MVKSKIDRSEKDSLGKSNERTLVSEMVNNCCAVNKYFVGLHNSLLMGLGQDQQLHLAVLTGGVSRGRVRGCGCY